MEAVWMAGGRIRPKVAAIKVLASSICLGSGGSAGREGPIVQIGSSIGSTVAQLFRLPEDLVKTLVACGAAAGISATSNLAILRRQDIVRGYARTVSEIHRNET